MGGTKTFFQGVNKGLFGDNVFQCGDAEPFRSLLSLGASLVLDTDVELRDNEAVNGLAPHMNLVTRTSCLSLFLTMT